MASLKYLGNLELMTVALASDYTAASGSMALTAGYGARLPSSGDFWIRTKTGTYQCFKVTARSTDTLTVVAAQDGTSDGNLSAGTELFWVLSYSALDQLLAERNRVLTVAQFDALGATEYRNGDRIVLSGGLYEVVRDSGAWNYLYQGRKVARPPSTGWSWDNQTTSAIDSTNGHEYLVVVRSGVANNLTLRYRTAPATPYTIKVALLHDYSGAPPGASGDGDATSALGVLFRDSAGKIITFDIGYSTTTGALIRTVKWTNSTTLSAATVTYSASTATPGNLGRFAYGQPQWFAISDDATDLKFYWSIDGLHWKLFDSRARGDFFTGGPGPNAYGFGAFNSTNNSEMALISMEETASGTP